MIFCAVFFWETTKSAMLCSHAMQKSCNSLPKLIPQPYISPSFDGSVILSLQITGYYSQSCYYILLIGRGGGELLSQTLTDLLLEHPQLWKRAVHWAALFDGCRSHLFLPTFPWATGTDPGPSWWQDQQFGPPGIIQSGISASCSGGDGGWVSAGGSAQSSWALLSHLCVWVCVHVQTARTSLFLFGRSVSKVYFVRAGQAPVSTLVTKSS